MRTIVHLSDIHFGRVNYSLVEPLLARVRDLRPDLVAISGDLTQRARVSQFKEARALLDQLPQPQLVVPGNHDVPLYNIIARFRTPLNNYRRLITDDLHPFYLDSEMAVAGINTARSFTWKGGRISSQQVALVVERMNRVQPDLLKIIVTHHPFELPAGGREADIVKGAHAAMLGLVGSGADLFLSGHLHLTYTSDTAKRYRIAGHTALLVQAGTTTSTRGRGEVNAFNVIRLECPQISVERYDWDLTSTFVPNRLERFSHSPDGWKREGNSVTVAAQFESASNQSTL